MLKQAAIATLLMTIGVCLVSCGGKTTSPIEQESFAPSEPGAPSPIAVLPALSELPPAARELSLVGPGWLPLTLRQRLSAANATDGTGGELILDASGGMAYAVYGIRGFDGDNGPTSAMLTASQANGQFYLAFSDYENGCWTHAGPFTGTVEAEIPNTGGYVSASAFVSPLSACYLAVIVPTGGSLTATRLNLGVHGGANAPKPPEDLTFVGPTATEVVLAWEASPSEADPDFAGYRLERAPAFYGTFAPIGTVPMMEQHYVDDSVQEGRFYRYRVAAVDHGGNLSMYDSLLLAGLVTTLQPNPVAILDLPAGPLYGPLQVTLDLSRSFDPSGGVIDTYEVRTPGLGTLTGANQFTVTLQPGCYVLSALVKVGARVGQTKRILKVYPLWKENPSTAFTTGGDLPRLKYVRSGRLPDGQIVHIGYDESIPAIAVRATDSGVPTLVPLTVALGDPVLIGEPVAYGDYLAAPVVVGSNTLVVSFNAEEASFSFAFFGISQPRCALVRMEDEVLGLVYTVLNGPQTDLMFASTAMSAPTIVDDNLNMPISGLDAVYHEPTGAVDIILGDAIETLWRRFKPGTGNLHEATLAPFDLVYVDMETDPVTGHSAMVHIQNVLPITARYQKQTADGESWELPVEIDNSDINVWPCDLVVTTDGAFVLNGLDNGGTAIWKLYEQDGGSWAVRGTTALEFGVKNNVTLIIEPGSTDAHATGYDLNAVTWQMLLPADGSPAQEEWKLQGARGQGREMHGTVGADGLHLIYRDEDPGLVYHLHSLTGSPWIFEGNPFSGATDLDLGATSEGEVYASGILSGNSAELHYWDGATWSMQLAWPTIAGFRPSLSDTRLEDIIHWAVYIQPTGNIRYAKGSQTTPFTFTAVAPDVGPVWDGTVCNAGYSMSYAELFTMAGSTAPSQSDFGLYGWYEPSFYEVLINTPVSPTPQDWGRVLDSCIYSNGYGTVRSFWVACATIGPSMIIDYYRDGERAIPLPHEFTLGDLAQSDIRRTVSTAYAWGGTALGLNCDLFGQTPIFMWSDFGDWEPLPMPPGLNPGEGGYISKPELIVGDDGRWHILYHDYDTDQIMVRSTI